MNRLTRATTKRILFCLAAITCLTSFIYAALRPESQSDTLRVVDAEAAKAFLSNREETAYDADNFGTLQINGVAAPFDAASATFYIPQSLETSARDGTLSWSLAHADILLPDDARRADKQRAIEQGHRFELLICRGKQYCKAGVVLTGMPMISVSTLPDNGYLIHANPYVGTIQVFDPAAGGDAYRVQTSNVTFHVRGHTSYSWPKSSYRLSLTTADGKTNHLSLLGMRTDDDWILNSMYADTQKNRDKVANDLWNDLCLAAASPAYIQSTHAEYAELVIDNAYQGVYCLMETVGRKSTGISEASDYLYKPYYGYAEAKRILEEQAYPFEEMLYRLGTFHWPQTKVSDAQYQSVMDYHDAFVLYRWGDRLEELYTRIDLNALIDLSLFINATGNTDSMLKNIYVIGIRQADGTFDWVVMPWDLNLSFGPSDTASADAAAHLDNVRTLYIRNEMEALMEYDPETVLPLLKTRWQALRKTLFSDAEILSRLQAATDGVVQSGAFARDSLAWPESGNNADLTPMLSYMRQRLAYLDEYYGGLA